MTPTSHVCPLNHSTSPNSRQGKTETGTWTLPTETGWKPVFPEMLVHRCTSQAMAEAGVEVPGFETGFVENYFRVFRKTNLAGISGIGACPAVPRWYQCGCQSPEAGPPGRNHMCYLPFSVSKPIGKCCNSSARSSSCPRKASGTRSFGRPPDVENWTKTVLQASLTSVFAQVYSDKPGHHVLYLEKSWALSS